MDKRTLLILEYDKIIHELTLMTHSPLGCELAAALTPVSDLAEVQYRQAETDDAVKIILEKGILPLNGMHDIRPAVTRSRSQAQLSCAELLRIGAFLRGVSRLRGSLPESYDPERILFGLLVRLQPLPEIEARLDVAIANEEELHDRASAELSSIRRRIRKAQNEVKDSLARLVRSHGRSLQEQLVTLRGDRYVVPVKAEHRGDIPGIVHDTSASGATLFVEPLVVVELNNRIRELIGLEREEVERILQELSALVAADADALDADAELVARLDFAMAKGRLALKMKGQPPVLNDRGRINLRSARHPLIPSDRVVPIDFELGTTFKTLVITGPNTGGKTVSLKTCGLLTLMAMAGLQIPARERSEISIFDEVLADIGDEQSIEQDLSTFSSHLRNIIRITTRARPKTLVLLDELGSGTDPSEGAALAIAILDYLRRKGCLTVATTHYKELKGYALRTPGVENACCEFDTDTLQPTYRLLIGVPGVSNAFVISQRLGLQAAIIEHARSLISEEEMHFEELIANVEKSRSEAGRLQLEARKLRDQAAEELRQHKILRDQLADKSRQVVEKARTEARVLYGDALQEIEEMMAEIRQLQREDNLAQKHLLATEARRKIRTGLGRIEQEIGHATLHASGEALTEEEIQIGRHYSAPALGIVGKVVEGPDNRGNYVLQSEAMRISVSADALRHPEAVADSSGKPQSRDRPGSGRKQDGLTMERRLVMNTEILLLGQTVEEASGNLDKFIDDAVLAGITSIRIVHGKGTGALRSAVHQQLKSDKRVKSFRLGSYGEGDSGVTLAELT
jgi:DNA mismatch repair protein MutS2